MEPLKKMPVELKRKLRKLHKLLIDARRLDVEIQNDLERARVPYENLVANSDDGPHTEALAYINNAEDVTKEGLNETITEIEKVYLYFANLPVEEEAE